METKLTAQILAKLKEDCPFIEIFSDTEADESGFRSYPRSKIGHIRADHDGWRWWNTVWPHHDELATLEMKREIDATYASLTAADALSDLPTTKRFCAAHPEARAGASDTEYNFYLEGELCNYWLRLITRKGDYNMYLSFYKKSESMEMRIV